VIRAFIAISLVLTVYTKVGLSQNVVIVIIDGARYSETFGDSTRAFIPAMDLISKSGTYIDEFYNDSMTWTSRAIPALWSGTWTEVRDTIYQGVPNLYSVKPSIFEYFRKQTNSDANSAYYFIHKIPSVWLQSFHPDYGPDWWQTNHAEGDTFDVRVWNEAKLVMATHHPRLAWLYISNVDWNGHQGIWDNYTRSIEIADSIVGAVWDFIQNDSIYKDNTTMFVTNDHGRHDDANGGYTGHGDGCPGCRRIMFLAVGPDIKQNYVSTKNRRIPDLAVTMAGVFGVDAEYATGEFMAEIFNTGTVGTTSETNLQINYTLSRNYPNPFNPTTTIEYSLPQAGYVSLIVFNLLGTEISRLVSGEQETGNHSISWNAANVASGIYFYRLQAGDFIQTRKMVLLK